MYKAGVIMNEEVERERVIDAGMHCFTQYGYEGTSMREVASRAECSTSILYKHFPDKNALFQVVFTQCAQIFCDTIDSMCKNIHNPMDRFMAFGNAFLRFALIDNGRKYRFIFAQHNTHMELSAYVPEDVINNFMNLFYNFLDTVTECQKMGCRLLSDVFTTAIMSWVFIAGLAHLGENFLPFLKDRVESSGPGNAHEMIDSMLKIFMKMMFSLDNGSGKK